jgi:hypothetical protein
MDWASSDLAFDDVSLPVSRLRVYRSELVDAITVAMPTEPFRATNGASPHGGPAL